MRPEHPREAGLRIIIVNWNAGAQLRACLASIPPAAVGAGFRLERVVVVDNASTDGSADGLEALPLPLTVLRNADNRGFAAACNQGAAGSEADFLLFLNPDTRLLADSLATPIAFLERPERRDIGIVGIQLLDDEGRVTRSCARFPTAGILFSRMIGLNYLFPRRFPSYTMKEWDHLSSRDVDQVMGAFLLVRRAAFEAEGGFDERFFVYMEDLDFSLRLRKAGWRSYYLTDARAYHTGKGTTEQIKATRLFYYLRSRIQYGYKHFGRGTATSLMLGTLLLEPVARVLLALSRRSPSQVGETLSGYALLWRSLWRKQARRLITQ